MERGLHIRAHYSPYDDYVEFLLVHRDEHGHRSTVRTLELTKMEPGECAVPTGRIDRTAAQVLMDDLWSAGIRPTEGAGTAGAMRATERHLDDMRKIAGAKLNVAL